MKIFPRNRRKAKWYPYSVPYYDSDLGKGYIHFEYQDGTIDLLTYVPVDFADQICNHFILTEEILYRGGTWNRFDEDIQVPYSKFARIGRYKKL